MQSATVLPRKRELPMLDDIDCEALVIGAGPAGLMAADVLSASGAKVLLVDAKASFGRKFLMAGKSGLNLTKSQPLEAFLSHYSQAEWLMPILARFGPQQVEHWAKGLGQEVFTGTSGRVFPVAMKASPLLRAWLARLAAQKVEARTRWRWTGWQGGNWCFATPEGQRLVRSRVCVLAVGGSSWARLGSDAAWVPILAERGVTIAPFRPSNVGFDVNFSAHMAAYAGHPVKPVTVGFGGRRVRGEFVVTSHGVEGGAIYALSHDLVAAKNAVLMLDLLPDLSIDMVSAKLAAPRGKLSLANFLRKSVGLTGVKAALFHEFCRDRNPILMAQALKSLPMPLTGARPIDEAISVAGGVMAASLDENLMLRELPGVFCAGEMLDWDAPTGGYLLTACLATGQAAGFGAMRRLQEVPG